MGMYSICQNYTGMIIAASEACDGAPGVTML